MAKAQEESGNEKPRNGPKGSESRQTLATSRPELPARVLPLPSPFGLMSRVMEDVVRLLDGVSAVQNGSRDVTPTLARFVPALELFERPGEVVVRLDVPGMNKDQITIEVDDRQLTITGERTEQRDERQPGLHRSERSYGHFSRVIILPEGVQPDRASATFSGGVLEIAIPAPDRPKPKQIAIKEEAAALPPQQASVAASPAA
jgi:HSP20 family protein